MKYCLLLAGLLLSIDVHADPAMVAKDGNQGQVVLTSEKLGGCGAERVAYLTRPLNPERPAEMITFWGCWAVDSNKVRVKYFVGNEARYERAAFSYEEVERVTIPEAVPSEDNVPEPVGSSA